MVDTAVPTGFIGWIQTNGQLVLFFAQIAYWLVICVAAVWATLIFRRLVNAKVGAVAAYVVAEPAAGAAAAQTAETAAVAPSTKPSIDEFVD